MIGMFAIVWLLLLDSLKKVSAWGIFLSWRCWIMKSYYYNLHNHLTLHPISRLAILTVSRAIWLVMMMKDFTSKYCLNFFTSHTIVRYSCSVIRYFFSCSLNTLLVQIMSCSFPSSPFWCKIALTPSFETSIYKIKGLSKSGWVITGAVIIFLLILSKAFCLRSVYSNSIRIPSSFLVSLYIGLVISENPLIYLR